MTPNKIVFIADARSIHSVKWINFIAQNTNNEIYWASLFEGNYEKLEKVNFLPISKSFLRNILRFTWFLFSNEEILVNLHYIGFHSLFLLFLNKKAKLVTNAWGSDLVFSKINIFRKIWLKFIISRSSIVISDCYHHYEFLKNYGLNLDNFRYVPYGTDTEKFVPKRECFSNENIEILNPRGLSEVYDPKTFILSAKKVLEVYPNIIFKLAGRGHLEKELKMLVNKMGISKNVIFLGFLSQSDLINEINASDIVVSCALRDGGIAGSTSEAMSCERLVVVTNNSDNHLWIKHGENGFLFENLDYINLSDVILKIIGDQKKLSLIAKNARKTILEKNSYSKQMNKIIKTYDKLIQTYK